MQSTADQPRIQLSDVLASPRNALAKFVGSLGRASHGEIRQALVPALRQVIDAGHASAKTLLAGPRNGLACARRISATMDGVISCLHIAATEHFYPAQNPSDSEHIAVVAVGGYGRGTLAPGSDIDLLFLFPHKQTAWGESVVEAMLYPLWDLKLKIGHSVRSVEDCLREARGDMTVRTALLEARFLTGDRALFDEMVRRFGAEAPLVLTRAEEANARLRIVEPGDTTADEVAVEEVARGFEYLTFLDVKPAAEMPGTAVGEGRFGLTEGLTVVVAGTKDGENFWVRLTAEGGSEAERLNARWRGWAYQVGNWKEKAFMPRLAELLPRPAEPEPPAEAAPSAPPESPAPPAAPAR